MLPGNNYFANSCDDHSNLCKLHITFMKVKIFLLGYGQFQPSSLNLSISGKTDIMWIRNLVMQIHANCNSINLHDIGFSGKRNFQCNLNITNFKKIRKFYKSIYFLYVLIYIILMQKFSQNLLYLYQIGIFFFRKINIMQIHAKCVLNIDEKSRYF